MEELTWLQVLRQTAVLFRESIYDANRYRRHARGFGAHHQQHLLAGISTCAHVIERGFSLPSPRPNFGVENLKELAGLLERFKAGRHSPDREQLRCARGALDAYRLFCDQNGGLVGESQDAVVRCLELLNAMGVRSGSGGADCHASEEVLDSTRSSFDQFVHSRRSVRNFSQEVVRAEEIERATAFAQTAPSACNRQSGRLHVFTAESDVKAILSHHIGNRGFGHVPAVAVLTADLRNFEGVRERHQGLVDGGLFAMSFMFGLHAVGLASCALNWSVHGDRDSRLRAVARIPDFEDIVLLVAFGHYPGKFFVARSARLPLNEVLKFGHES